VVSGLIKLEPGFVIAFYGIDNLRFLTPVFIGDTLWADLEVVKKTTHNDKL